MKEQYYFVKVQKELTDTDAAFTSGKLHVCGYRPTFLNTGTVILYVDNRPFKPGDQWHENVPEQHPIDAEYDIQAGQDLAGYPDVAGLIAKPGVWLRVTYYEKTDFRP
jgi:hypothetical protein